MLLPTTTTTMRSNKTESGDKSDPSDAKRRRQQRRIAAVTVVAGAALLALEPLQLAMERTLRSMLVSSNTYSSPSPSATRTLVVAEQGGGDYRVEISDSSENELPSGFVRAASELNPSKTYDVCAIGAGLSGTVFAERSANLLEKRVLVIDSRPHIGGNCYDFIDQKTGVLRNQYGSHLFHTNIERVWNYVTSNPKAPTWKRWYHYKFGLVNGTYVPIPVNIQTVNRLLDLDIRTPEEMNEWLKTVQIPCPKSTGCEDAEQMAKSRVGERLYDLIYKGYTIKQWGMEPRLLNASVTARIPVFANFDPRYFNDKYQALPGDGYTAWFAAMLDHPLIDVVLGIDFFKHRQHLERACGKIVYTGPIDRYFESTGMERLEYRSIRFTEYRHYNHPGYVQPTPVVNYPLLDTPYTRAVEYKHYLHRPSNHSIVVKETSASDGEPYYPVPTKRNQELYERYRLLAADLERTGKILFVGRLANYKYFNMDQAIDNALTLFYRDNPFVGQKVADRQQLTPAPTVGEAQLPPQMSGTAVAKEFMSNEFQQYKADISRKMEAFQAEQQLEPILRKAECKIPFWDGEFGMELRVMVPWAYHIWKKCGSIATQGVPGTKYLYFFNKGHTIVANGKRGKRMLLPKGNPLNAKSVHIGSIPGDANWLPPPFASFFRSPELVQKLLARNNNKPLIVVLNKYTKEWSDGPVNFMSKETVRHVLEYLTPNYTVLYKRHTANALIDHHGKERDLGEKDMIREEFPSVLLFEDFAAALDNDDDMNLLLFGFMSMSNKFLTVQGGNAVVGSYFGGTTVILIKKGKELKHGDYNYFHRFSNATIIPTQTDEAFIEEVKKNM